MDRGIEEELKKAIARMDVRLEQTLDVILQHFKETDERIEALEKKKLCKCGDAYGLSKDG